MTIILSFHYLELVFSITETIDLVSPLVANHHKIVGYISHCLGEQLGLTTEERIELEIAGSLHDIGGLTLLERLIPTEFEYKDCDFHAEKGYLLLNRFKPFSRIAKIIRYHHNNWLNGKCLGINNQKIPFGSHVLNLADRISILIKPEDKYILNGIDKIRETIGKRKGDIFHPLIVDAFMELSKKDSFWLGMQYIDTPEFIMCIDNSDLLSLDDENFEDFIKLMSSLVDYKSRFTASHSASVAACSEIIAQYVGFSANDIKTIKYSGYIHDLGKLAIPTEILEKTDALSKREFDLIRTHAYHTNRVLSKVGGFGTIRIWGSLHHEKLNGSGYPFGLKDEEIPMGARIIAVADIFTAIREKRPYRDPMTKRETINILVAMAENFEIDRVLVEVVTKNFDELEVARDKAHLSTQYEYERFTNELEDNSCLIQRFA